MKPRVRPRLPLFELSMLLILAVLGWAAVELYRVCLHYTGAEQRWQQQVRQVEQSWKRYVLDVRTLYTTVFDAQHTVKLRETYYSLAGRLEADLPEVHSLLTNAVADKATNELTHFEARGRDLRDWLRQNRLRVESEVLVGKSLELQEKMARAFSQTQQPPAMADLGRLLELVDESYASYLKDAGQVARSARLGLSGHPVPDYIAKAGRDVSALLQLAEQSRRSGKAIETLPDLPLSATEALVNFPQHNVDITAGGIGDDAGDLRTLLHTVVAVWVALVLVCIAALYRGLVVAPLREKLRVSDSVIEHQNKLAHLGQLLATLAHEIRNPLTAINARLFTLQKSVPKGTPEHKDTQVIRGEITRLDQIVTDYLKLTKPAEPRFLALKAEDVYEELRDLLEPDLARQGVQLKMGPATGTLFRGDPQQMKQVLINLIQNAAEAMDGGGIITLSAKRDGARLQDGKHEAVVLEVADNGSGIPRDVQEKLFDPFFSTKENGTGLGLAITAQIVEKHGGAIDFDTRQGQGTTFRVTVPVFNGHQ